MFDLSRPLRMRGLYRTLKLIGMQPAEGGNSPQPSRTVEEASDTQRRAHNPAVPGPGPTRRAYVIEAAKADGNTDKLYFDAETGLLLRCDLGVAPGRYGLTWYFDAYRDVDGVKVPYRLVYRQNFAGSLVDTIFEFDEVVHNLAIDDAEFEKPGAKP